MANIEPGYRLTITSWENDADHYKDMIFEGLAKEDVSYLIEVAQLFRSMSMHTGGFGGSARHYKMDNKGRDFWTDVADAMDVVLAKHPNISDKIRAIFEIERVDEDGEEDEYWHGNYDEAIHELVSYPGEGYGDEGYIRVYSGHVVHFIKTEVEDVTEEFK